MKKYLITLFCIMLISVTLRAEAVLTVGPFGNQSNSIEFLDVKPGNGSAVQFYLYVTAAGTTAWNINMYYDYFQLSGSTETIPYYSATYVILKNSCDPYISSSPIPWFKQTVYIATPDEFSTKGTTISLSINLHPELGSKFGKYRSNLHVELGDKL